MHIWQDGYIYWNCRMVNNKIEYRNGGVWTQIVGTAYEILEDANGNISFGRRIQA